MILDNLMQELEYEVESTRKLLQAIPEKGSRLETLEIFWRMGELAQHIATIYDSYEGT